MNTGIYITHHIRVKIYIISISVISNGAIAESNNPFRTVQYYTESRYSITRPYAMASSDDKQTNNVILIKRLLLYTVLKHSPYHDVSLSLVCLMYHSVNI